MIRVYLFRWTKYNARRLAPAGLPSEVLGESAPQGDDKVGVLVGVPRKFLIRSVAGFRQYKSGDFAASYNLSGEVPGDEF